MEKEKIAPNPNEAPTLDAVLSGFENYLTEVTQSIIQASPEGEDKILVESTSATLLSQMKKVNDYIRDSHGQLSTIQKEEFQTFLRIQDGVNMAQQGIETCKKMFKKGGFGKKLLGWLAKWFEEIKKIIREIIKFLCFLFGWAYPTWLDPLLVLLNEILSLIVKMFGETLGIEPRSFGRELSEMEVDYLNELAALERLQQAQRFRFVRDDEG
ncbi:MAG: hypothetical protein ACKVUS_02185 [Saprospiraceae bacterium]